MRAGDEPDTGLVLFLAIGGALLAALEVYVLISDGPDEGDPATLLWGMPITAFVLAVFGLFLRQRLLPGMVAVVASGAVSLAWLGVVAVSVG